MNGGAAPAQSFRASLRSLATSALKGAAAGGARSFLSSTPGKQVVREQVTLETAKLSRWLPWLLAGAALALLVFLVSRR